MSDEQKLVRRRTLAKGAAWTIPTVALAAAAPSASASPAPQCPDCFRSGTVAAPVVSAADILTREKATVFPFPAALTVDARSCPATLFSPAYVITASSATLTMTDGASYTSTGVATGTGTLGNISAIGATYNFSNVTLSPGPGRFGTGNYPTDGIRPAKFCVDFNFRLVTVGSPPITLNCPQTLCWSISSTPVGALVAHRGLVTFTSTLTPA